MIKEHKRPKPIDLFEGCKPTNYDDKWAGDIVKVLPHDERKWSAVKVKGFSSEEKLVISEDEVLSYISALYKKGTPECKKRIEGRLLKILDESPVK